MLLLWLSARFLFFLSLHLFAPCLATIFFFFTLIAWNAKRTATFLLDPFKLVERLFVSYRNSVTRIVSKKKRKKAKGLKMKRKQKKIQNHGQHGRAGMDNERCIKGQGTIWGRGLNLKTSDGVSVHILPGSIGLQLNLLILSGKDVVRIPKSTNLHQRKYCG